MYSNILQKIDIAGMSNGLEIRPPYLDDRIINFSKSLDAENNLSFKQSKLFLGTICTKITYQILISLNMVSHFL